MIPHGIAAASSARGRLGARTAGDAMPVILPKDATRSAPRTPPGGTTRLRGVAVRLSGRLAEWAEGVGAGAIDLSMTHSRELANAVAVVSDA